MDTKGKICFDQGIVVNNDDPERLGRVKVRMLSDGINSKDSMHKGDDELPWYEPCILGAGYEVGSLTIPPVGSFLWCIENKFDTENVFRVYLGSAYGSGPQNNKQFNAMLTPKEVIETPSEALINYPQTQLLYKSTEGSYLKFYGDDLAGFELGSGIPIEDANGNTDSIDTDTYNFVYGDREEILLGVSEMPDPIDKAEPEEPEDIPISRVQLNSDHIYSGIVRDRGGDTFNNQEITPGGIYMTVRGNGGTTSPSENKELEDSATKTLNDAEAITQTAGNKALKDVTKKDGALDTQNKILKNETEKTVNTATTSACKLPSKETGMTKKETSFYQERVKQLAIKLPGGYGFLQSAMAGALQGNIKTLTHHILTQVSSTVFSLASALVRDTFDKILSDPKLINTEEASKFVDKIIGEANLDKLVGKAKTMIATIGGKLGPFGQMFERVSNTVLGMAMSQIGAINQLNNKIGSLANIKRIFDQIRPNINSLISTGLNSVIESSSKTCIDVCNQALAGQNISNVTNLAQSYLAQLGIGTAETSQQQTNTNENTTQPNTNSSSAPVNTQTTSTNSQTNTAESVSNTNENKLTPEEEETVRQLASISGKAMQKAISESVESVVNTLISKTLDNTTENTEQEVEATDEYENILYLDADGIRSVIPGEELSNSAKMDNDGAEVHIGENCLFQMTPSNIMQFVSDPDYENQTSRIIASDGINDTVNSDTFNHTAKSMANLYRHDIDNGTSNSNRIYAGMGLGYDEENQALASTIQLVTANGETPKSQAVFSQSIANEAPANTFMVSGDQGTQSSSIQMEKDKITFIVGMSSMTLNFDGRIDIKGTKINIGGLSVHLGAAVNLGLVPDLGFDTPQKCTMTTGDVEWTSKNVEWKPTKINIS